ncbi:MAG TPA: hypothetical protein PLK37_13705 [Terricaulis sp.]|nr:hypothetical protein [Terricaulis sp.]
MFKFIGQFLSGLWRASMFWRIPPFEDPSAGVRVGNRLGGSLMFLFLLFFFVALVLVVAGSLFGFTIEDVLGGADAVLAQLGPSLDFIGKVLIQKVLMALILAVCAAVAVMLVFFRNSVDSPSWWKTILILLGCLMVGYCSAVNMLAPLDPYDPSLGDQYYYDP